MSFRPSGCRRRASARISRRERWSERSQPRVRRTTGRLPTRWSRESEVHNSSFAIVGNELRIAELLNFEEKQSYSVRIRSTAEDGSFTEKVFTISVDDVDEYDVSPI